MPDLEDMFRTTSQLNSPRKEEHLAAALEVDVESKGVSTGLEGYRFIHQALPEIDLADVSLSTTLFGKPLKVPLVILPMVGGIEKAERLNRNLAEAAQAMGVAMGVGSQRCLLEDPATTKTYQVRDVAPDILLFANLGAVQLNYGYGISECLRAVESIGADALVLHLNPLHEALQAEGNTNFSGLLEKIKTVCLELPVPVIVKEVGSGISEDVARKLAVCGIAGIDTAGAGGTSWSEIEKLRARTESAANIAANFASWGIPTGESIRVVRGTAPGLLLIASGGIRTGLDLAKVIALGADVGGIAIPLLKAANVSAGAVVAAIREIVEVLRISMFCIGAADLNGLKNSPFLVKGTGT